MLTSRALRLVLATVVGLVVASSAPALASAAQRYASPGGSGLDCTSAKPCGLVDAVTKAIAGDEVIVAPGDYPLAAMLFTPPKIAVHGVAGKPRPRLLFDGPNAAFLQMSLESSARYLELDQAPGASTGVLVLRDGSTADQVIAKGSGEPMTVYVDNSTIRNSIVVANGPTATRSWCGRAPLRTPRRFAT